MKMKTFALAGAAGSFVVAGAASAAFTGIAVEEYVGDGWTDNGYDAGALTTWRLYAEFDGEGDDGVLSPYGISGVPATVTSTSNSFWNAPTGLDSLTAPSDLTGLGIWENQWDTYVTVGTDNADGDATSISPGFADETNNLAMSWSSENVGWFVTPDDEQSRAVDGRVYLAQFTVEQGGDGDVTIFGTMNMLLRDGEEVVQYAWTPAPGALALLGLAGLAGRPRRRDA